ncbi:MAG: GntR family transcriptional regulator [Anaerolineae bacterium]|jgi:DNA-binding GntR family transcriptional regulator|nr:GntR family transcriptional regulator [Anaerolineae bacterium]
MSKALSPIEENRRTLAAQVAERIRQAILTRDLAPGSRVNQYQLAEDLNVSLVPVREALKTLEAEGLVTITPRRGAFVTEISLDDLDELYFARKLVEGEAIALACQALSDHDFVILRGIIDEMRAATANDDIHAFMQYNRDFHMHIYSATKNRHLFQMIETLWDRSELYRYRYMFVLRNADVIHQEHEDIFTACQTRNVDRARQLAQDHIWHTRNGIYQQLASEFATETSED